MFVLRLTSFWTHESVAKTSYLNRKQRYEFLARQCDAVIVQVCRTNTSYVNIGVWNKNYTGE